MATTKITKHDGKFQIDLVQDNGIEAVDWTTFTATLEEAEIVAQALIEDWEEEEEQENEEQQ